MPHLTASDRPRVPLDRPSSILSLHSIDPSSQPSAALSAHHAKRASRVIDFRPVSEPRFRLLHARLPSFSRSRARTISSENSSNPPSPIADHRASTYSAFGADQSQSCASPSLKGTHHSDLTQLQLESQESLSSVTVASRVPTSPSPNQTKDLLVHSRAISQLEARNMHQTSSRLLRMTDDDRPFTRDFKDLFSTLMVSLPLTPHRVRFTRIEHTFTTDEAITNLGSLKFSQSNRMPDPKDPSRIVTTTTTTTFSMAKEMARSVCTKFVEARFIESCEGKTDFTSKSAVWQLTPKGMRVLTRFCSRNGIHQRHVNELLDSPRNMMQLVILERESDTDRLQHDRSTVEVIFRRFCGETGPNLKATTTSSSDTDSLNEYATGLVGVRVTKSTKPSHKDTPYVFNGKSAVDWVMDCCMVVDRRECYELANLFMAHELIQPIENERHIAGQRFQATKSAQYIITDKGMRIAGWVKNPQNSVSSEREKETAPPASKMQPPATRDSNTNRMTIIIRDAALRLLFREFLQETHCEENLTFYLEVKNFLVDYGVAKRSQPQRLDLIRETLASAYSLYNAFLAPGSPCELNIDHNLRNALAGRMTRAVGEDQEMLISLDEVAVLFDQAQTSVFKLMASDSVPKFSRDPKYASVLRDRNLEHLLTTFPTAV